jgi:DNA-binding transcriptional MerR regulator
VAATSSETEPRLSIGQVAQRTGLSVHALRFYEREGMFPTPVHRDTGGHRLYSEWDLEWLEVCSKLRTSGMPLTAIRRYAELVRWGAGNEAERPSLLREHQQHVRGQIITLIECLELISFKVRLYETCLAEGWTDPLLLTPAQDQGSRNPTQSIAAS